MIPNTVDEIMRGMTLPDKIGRMVRAVSVADNLGTSDVRRLIAEGKVGSLTASGHRHLDAGADIVMPGQTTDEQVRTLEGGLPVTIPGLRDAAHGLYYRVG